MVASFSAEPQSFEFLREFYRRIFLSAYLPKSDGSKGSNGHLSKLDGGRGTSTKQWYYVILLLLQLSKGCYCSIWDWGLEMVSEVSIMRKTSKRAVLLYPRAAEASRLLFYLSIMIYDLKKMLSGSDRTSSNR